MKNADTVHLRYMGIDSNRRFILQRADLLVWTGGGWSRVMDDAWVFYRYEDAAAAVQAMMTERHRGKPSRTFKLELEVTLTADRVDEIATEDLNEFLNASMRVGIDNTVDGDGPVDGSYVHVGIKSKAPKETTRPKKVR